MEEVIPSLPDHHADEGFDESINPPEEWGGISTKTILKQMLSLTDTLPKSYTRGRVVEWNDFNKNQKQKMLLAWGNLEKEKKCKILNVARAKFNLSNESQAAENWNVDDWARLIHLFADPALTSLWTRTLHPKIVKS